jgi:hypothetical protein
MGIRSLKTASIANGVKRSKFWDQSANISDHLLIATATVTSGSTSSITFSSIPQTYDHLQLYWNARTTGATTTDFVHVRFNGDNTANYNFNFLEAGTGISGLSPAISTKSANTNAWLTRIAGGNNSANIFGIGYGIIADYSKTNRKKSLHTYGGYDDWLLGTPTGNTRLENSTWFSTAAITSITLTVDSGASFATNTDFTLYGIKG